MNTSSLYRESFTTRPHYCQIVAALIGFPRTEFSTRRHSSLARKTNLVQPLRFSFSPPIGSRVLDGRDLATFPPSRLEEQMQWKL